MTYWPGSNIPKSQGNDFDWRKAGQFFTTKEMGYQKLSVEATRVAAEKKAFVSKRKVVASCFFHDAGDADRKALEDGSH